MMPDIAIFRIDDPEQLTLGCFQIVDGQLDLDGGEAFTVDPEDWYAETEFNHLILANSCEGGSMNSRRFVIGNQLSDVELRVCDLTEEAINMTVTYVMLTEYPSHFNTIH